MASLKRLGFFWGDEKITVVDFEKNAPIQVASAPLGSKTNTSSPFSSNLTEEIQITAILKKLLQDNKISGGGNFYVSLPMKEIILRSFVIPFVKQEDIQNAIKFEAKKYIPFDIQDLSYVFHTIPFTEGQNKRLQVIFFAARKEVLARYERIFKQVNASVSYGEPYIVSLAKSLLFRKEIKPTDHLAFLILDKNLGRICFIDKGIPQFIREFPIAPPSQSEEANDSIEALNLKIVNEVGNSFDFYTRQFSGDRIEQVLVSSEFIQKDLIDTLEAELKLKIAKFSPVINTGTSGQSQDIDAIYAMGACVAPPIESLSKFNFLAESPKAASENKIISVIIPYKDIVLTFLLCVFFLGVIFALFQVQLKFVQHQYDQISAKEGAYSAVTTDSIQTEVQQSIDQLTQYKNIRTKSDITTIILKLASHLPVGTMITELNISYNQNDVSDAHVAIDMKGHVVNDDPNKQIEIVNQVYSDLENDKDLAHFISSVVLVSFNPETYNNQQVTGFNFHCS
jgi:Tfp pilus assembly PilM family ATPase